MPLDESEHQGTDLIVRSIHLAHQRTVIPIRHLDDVDIMVACRVHGFAKHLILVATPIVVSVGVDEEHPPLRSADMRCD